MKKKLQSFLVNRIYKQGSIELLIIILQILITNKQTRKKKFIHENIFVFRCREKTKILP